MQLERLEGSDGAGPCGPREELGLSLNHEQGERASSPFGRLLLWAAEGSMRDRKSGGQALAGTTMG